MLCDAVRISDATRCARQVEESLGPALVLVLGDGHIRPCDRTAVLWASPEARFMVVGEVKRALVALRPNRDLPPLQAPGRAKGRDR